MGDVLAFPTDANSTGNVLAAAAGHSLIAAIACTLGGDIVMMNKAALARVGLTEQPAHLAQFMAPEMTEVFRLEAMLVLRSGKPMRYVAEGGTDPQGKWLSSRCSGWEPSYRQFSSFVEVLPISRKQGVVLRISFKLSEILQHLPD